MAFIHLAERALAAAFAGLAGPAAQDVVDARPRLVRRETVLHHAAPEIEGPLARLVEVLAAGVFARQHRHPGIEDAHPLLLQSRSARRRRRPRRGRRRDQLAKAPRRRRERQHRLPQRRGVAPVARQRVAQDDLALDERHAAAVSVRRRRQHAPRRGVLLATDAGDDHEQLPGLVQHHAARPRALAPGDAESAAAIGSSRSAAKPASAAWISSAKLTILDGRACGRATVNPA
jgi:hypothetical protein